MQIVTEFMDNSVKKIINQTFSFKEKVSKILL